MKIESEDITKEELIKENDELNKMINEGHVGMYFNRHSTPEKIVSDYKDNVPVLIHDKDKDIIKGKEENILIEGDNFFALEALNLIYPNGYVDAIYIDPPYNTGNKDFQYNDRFVDTEDGYKHTKWLNFMEKRLTLAKSILKDNGIIYISIDEHEFAQLKLLCDSIFGESNYIENFIWIKNSTKNLSKTTSTNHEYVLCYAKNKDVVQDEQIFREKKPGIDQVEKLLRNAKEKNLDEKKTQNIVRQYYHENSDLKGISMYDNVDIMINPETGEKEYRLFTLADLSAPKATGKAETYEIIHPVTGRACKTPTTGWRFTRQKMEENIKNNLIYFYDDETHVPRYKRYLDTVTTDVMKSVIEDFTDGKKELMRVFGGDAPFSNAKPTTLLNKLLRITKNDAVILDFFAGSGTTAQAVLELNKEDGGHRKFILCTNNENNIMTDVCYPRIKTVITGIRPDGSKYSDGLPGSVRYFKTGFVSDNEYKEQAKYDLVEQCDGLLCILESAFDKCGEGRFYNIYTNMDKSKGMAIFNDDYSEKYFQDMLEDLKKSNFKENVIYYFKQDDERDSYIESIVSKEIPDAEAKPIPSKIYEIYKHIADELRRDY